MRSRLLLAAVLAAALLLRVLPGWIAAGGARAEPGLAYTDPASAYELRRVAVGLASGEVPALDRFLAHPGGAEPPHGPLLAALLLPAGVRAASGPPGMRRVDPALLERRMLGVGPLLGALLVLAGAWAAGRSSVAAGVAGGGTTRLVAAARPPLRPVLAAAAVLAAAPVLVQHGQPGRLSAEVAAAILVAVQAGWVAASLRSPERVDRLGGALVGGLAGGLALAASPLAAVGALAGWAALLAGIARSGGGAGGATDRRRAGLLYLLALALVAQAPRLAGPWAASRGPGETLATAVAGLALLGAVPFLAGLGPAAGAAGGRARGPGRAGPGAATLCALLGLLTLVGIGSAVTGAALAAVLRPEALGFGAAAPWAASTLPLLPLVLVGLGRMRADPVALQGGLLAGAAGVLALWSPAAAPLAWTGLALCVALALAAPTGAAPAPRGRWVAALALCLPPLVAGARGLGAELADVGERRELVAALRGLPGRLPAPGPWTSARARPDFGVLAEPRLALLATWHARLPAARTPPVPEMVRSPDPGWRAGGAGVSRGAGDVEERPMSLERRPDARYLLLWARDGTGRPPGGVPLSRTVPRVGGAGSLTVLELDAGGAFDPEGGYELDPRRGEAGAGR